MVALRVDNNTLQTFFTCSGVCDGGTFDGDLHVIIVPCGSEAIFSVMVFAVNECNEMSAGRRSERVEAICDFGELSLVQFHGKANLTSLYVFAVCYSSCIQQSLTPCIFTS